MYHSRIKLPPSSRISRKKHSPTRKKNLKAITG